jgi:hypothetical protein
MKISVTCMHLLDLDFHQHKEINHEEERKVLSRKYCLYIPFFLMSYRIHLALSPFLLHHLRLFTQYQTQKDVAFLYSSPLFDTQYLKLTSLLFIVHATD